MLGPDASAMMKSRRTCIALPVTAITAFWLRARASELISLLPSVARVMGQFEKVFPQGLKPAIVVGHFMYRLKPAPFKLTHIRRPPFQRNL